MFKEIIKWNKERGITQDFNVYTEMNMISEEVKEMYVGKTDSDRADALCDTIVLAVGGLWKLGYDPEIAMEETLKEINSRKGSIDEDTGKWMKKWTGDEYKANYGRAKV